MPVRDVHVPGLAPGPVTDRVIDVRSNDQRHDTPRLLPTLAGALQCGAVRRAGSPQYRAQKRAVTVDEEVIDNLLSSFLLFARSIVRILARPEDFCAIFVL